MTKPKWIRTKWPEPSSFNRVANLLDEFNINTICRSARCPNRGECFSRNNVTFMILGNKCTRRCRFCSVSKGAPLNADPNEIKNIVKVVSALGLNYVIITSVTRDDLPDGGAGMFSDLVNQLKTKFAGIKVEILTPDYFGKPDNGILNAKPYIWAHNVETVPSLYYEVRPQADYKRSIKLLKSIKLKCDEILTKSGIMLGFGEETSEVLDVLCDLRNAGVDIITIGQYLKPSNNNIDVKRFLLPEEFFWYREKAIKLGFKRVISGPLVRSSYKEGGVL